MALIEFLLGLIEFLGIMNGWRNEDIMKKVWCKLIALQPALRHLNSKEIKYISHQIDKARYELSKIQEELYDQATNDLVYQEKEILMKLEKWSMIDESALRQKSRTKWI
ncbi:hypothetical protein KY284_013246 [Solanum tuberosum]|nr:hypothetical protein KY284_013246 [Solanum tuberosum]